MFDGQSCVHLRKWPLCVIVGHNYIDFSTAAKQFTISDWSFNTAGKEEGWEYLVVNSKEITTPYVHAITINSLEQLKKITPWYFIYPNFIVFMKTALL